MLESLYFCVCIRLVLTVPKNIKYTLKSPIINPKMVIAIRGKVSFTEDVYACIRKQLQVETIIELLTLLDRVPKKCK